MKHILIDHLLAQLRDYLLTGYLNYQFPLLNPIRLIVQARLGL